MAKEEVKKKVKDGKIEVVKTKREREEEALIQIGGRNKKGGKAPKKRQENQQDYQDEIFTNVDISILSLFSLLRVSPPQNKEALEPKLSELQEKLKFYNVEGEKRLQEEEEKVLAGTIEEE